MDSSIITALAHKARGPGSRPGQQDRIFLFQFCETNVRKCMPQMSPFSFGLHVKPYLSVKGLRL